MSFGKVQTVDVLVALCIVATATLAWSGSVSSEQFQSVIMGAFGYATRSFIGGKDGGK